MGFKLGTNRGNYAVNGEIKNKMRFGNQSGNPDVSVPGTPIIRTGLAKGINGEANMDGSIYISDKLEPGGMQERQTIIHEMRHATDMKIGKLEYADDYIKYNGETFPRKTIKRKDMILIEGEWKEAGDTSFPWEMDANNGNH
jgi:hypothetical protein|tara:strand:+ start:130 stop:555 length:426 start_codon:yes stop_codon:yes gene_type:complete